MPAYAFLGRDGTLVREHADEDWRGRTDLELLPGVGPALWALHEAGLLLVVVTSQYLIGKGYLTPDEYDQQTRSLTEALAAGGVVLDDVLHCPHARAATRRSAATQWSTDRAPSSSATRGATWRWLARSGSGASSWDGLAPTNPGWCGSVAWRPCPACSAAACLTSEGRAERLSRGGSRPA